MYIHYTHVHKLHTCTYTTYMYIHYIHVYTLHTCTYTTHMYINYIHVHTLHTCTYTICMHIVRYTQHTCTNTIQITETTTDIVYGDYTPVVLYQCISDVDFSVPAEL